MNKKLFFFTFLFGLALCLPRPVRADIEAVIGGMQATVINVQANAKTVQDASESVTKLKDTVAQGVTGVMDNVNEIKEVATNPALIAGAVTDAVGGIKTKVLGGLQGAVDGSQNEDELIENVTENYTREFGADNSITKAKKLQAAINKNLGENAAILYARVLVLRQEMMREKNPDHSLENIQETLKANNEILLQSLRRWNKILEMQAAMNEYNNSIEMQNFTRDAEESGDEK